MADDKSGIADGSMIRRGVLGLSAAGAALGGVAGAGLGLLAPRAAQAQEAVPSRLQTVLDRGHLIVGTGSTNPPWHFEDETGKLVGMDIDMARLLAKSLFEDPEKIEFVLQGSDARIPSLVTDKVDVICQWMTVTAGRAQQVEFTHPYYREGVGLMLMAEGGRFKNYDEMKAAGADVTVGAMQNVFIADWTKMALPDAKLDQFESPDATLQALNAGRIDTYLADQSAMRWLMAQAPGRYLDSGFGWMPNSYASAVKPGDPIWLNWVNTVYKEAMMGVDFDSFKASYKKWFGIDLPTPKVGFPTEFS
ncbi:MAG TPA: transporter substrate-binding domain-containing protein [Geminicoccus sp.]|jgi:polar amino acid transport system substrate-binding protein|uniref:transporter substrate-binding domain-containing protein n=1 Tax=Geminicoccus sp. TaxID=2024832 RepID=UPI002E2F0FC7|nr:transporter substrate-binding domain-containing protein [Geminicoccus sp.]HEX2528068.1 transporter substrate-binding domain-containing protein [Geminicoccus sp.]